jgi:hypothetical protein
MTRRAAICLDCARPFPSFAAFRRCFPCRRARRPKPKPLPVIADEPKEDGLYTDLGHETGWNCLHMPSPCAFKSCRNHMGFDLGANCAVRRANAGTATLEEVGELFGITRERVRQIEAQVIRKLKHAARVADGEASGRFVEPVRKRKRRTRRTLP